MGTVRARDCQKEMLENRSRSILKAVVQKLLGKEKADNWQYLNSLLENTKILSILDRDFDTESIWSLLLILGQERFSNGDYSTARNIYNKVLDMNPGSEVAREVRVRARECQKELLDKR